MEEAVLKKFYQVTAFYKENFKSSTTQSKDEEYIDRLHKELDQWKLHTGGFLTEIIDEKLDEIRQMYDQYCDEMTDRYDRIKEQVQNNRSLSEVNDQLDEFEIYCQSNTFEKRLELRIIPFTKRQLAEKIQVDYVPYRASTENRPIRSSTPVSKPTSTLDSSTPGSPPTKTTKKKPVEDISQQNNNQDKVIPPPITDSSNGEPFVSKVQPTTTTTTETDDKSSKRSTRIYVGRKDILTPVLIGTNRDVRNENEQLTEYSIDSIRVPHDKQQSQSLDTITDDDNDQTLVHAYKVLIQNENENLHPLTPSSNPPEHEASKGDNTFHLQQLNQIDYSTIMFQQCETEYNCIASSTKRNELLVYNSKLKVLIILQHENYQQCRQRFYLLWPELFSSHISDITYCENNDHFLISTFDTGHIYSFDRETLSIDDLGKLPDKLELRRIHCYQQTVYCILSNNYLLRYRFNEQYSELQFIQRIMLFDPNTRSNDTAYHLLDISCDKDCLIVLYVDHHDEIHLQSLNRQTNDFNENLVLEKTQPINQRYIRIESTVYSGNFIYLNGSQQQLKAIDFTNSNRGKITSMVRRHTKPTNICFLKDGRLVILYEDPYFLSIHGTHIRCEID